MSNFDKAVSLIYQAELEHIGHTNDLRSHPSVYVSALQANGLLMPDMQIIRTVEELEALDPMTIVQPNPSGDFQHEVLKAESLLYVVSRWGWEHRLPAVVLATGGQVQAAQKALEEEDE